MELMKAEVKNLWTSLSPTHIHFVTHFSLGPCISWYNFQTKLSWLYYCI